MNEEERQAKLLKMMEEEQSNLLSGKDLGKEKTVDWDQPPGNDKVEETKIIPSENLNLQAQINIPNWEYKTIKFSVGGITGGAKIDDGEIEKQLNAMGLKGWELVSTIVSHRHLGQSTEIALVLKRQKPSP